MPGRWKPLLTSTVVDDFVIRVLGIGPLHMAMAHYVCAPW
jgi:hypothetical protein